MGAKEQQFCDPCGRWISTTQIKNWASHVNKDHHKKRVKVVAERDSLWKMKYSTTGPIKIKSTRETDLAVAVQRNPNLIIIGSTDDTEGETGTVACQTTTQKINGGCLQIYHNNWGGSKRWDIFTDFAISVEVPSDCKTRMVDCTLSCVWHEFVWYNGSTENELTHRVSCRNCTLEKKSDGFRDKRIAFAKKKLALSLMDDELPLGYLILEAQKDWPLEDIPDLTVEEEQEFISTFSLNEQAHYTPVIQHFSRFDCHPCNMRYTANKIYSNKDDMEAGERDKINKSGALEFWRGGLSMKKEKEKSKRSGATLPPPPGFHTCAPLDSLQSMQRWIVNTGYKVPYAYEHVGPLGLLEKERDPGEDINDKSVNRPAPPTFAQRMLSRIELQHPSVETLGEIIEGIQQIKRARI